ncbi:hypothetical protein VKT23_020472 [Stygiomarasmius scandens]|uniref:Uncharacterized protein n=1 Tax=Marasmiellus scandens TaxID=2682957 RepID=A0ABR1ILG2_9AGAR
MKQPTSAFDISAVVGVLGETTLLMTFGTQKFKTIILDLGDVLFTWSDSSSQMPVSHKLIRGIVTSATWFEYEKGNFTEHEAYTKLAIEFGCDYSVLIQSFSHARDSLKVNHDLLVFIRDLQASGLRVYAMSNISHPDQHFILHHDKLGDWNVFNGIFSSADAKERKPNIGFYNFVIKQTGINPFDTIFVDDKVENVLTACSLGMRGIIFDNTEGLIRQIKALCDDPIRRAHCYLATNSGRFNTTAQPQGFEVKENFTQLLILDMTSDESLVHYTRFNGKFNFFQPIQSQGRLTTTAATFPDDLDTTSIALTVVPYMTDLERDKVMDEMLLYVNSDGIIQVYFDHARPRIDPIVCCNVLTLFHRYGRGNQLQKTMDWVADVLKFGACASGTRYYVSEDQFLFFVCRLCDSSTAVQHRLGGDLRARITSRIGCEGDPLSLAMRIYAAAKIGIVDKVDLDRLLLMQRVDGSWSGGVFYKFPSIKQVAINDGLSTVIAVQAIELVQHLSSQQSS